MLERCAANIRQVGPALTADFMKNIGFHMFVKPDFHFLREFPQLSGLETSFSPRDSFCLGWLLASALKMPAFVLDHTLYQWGRHGEMGKEPSARKAASSPASEPPNLSTRTSSDVAGIASESEQILESLLRMWRAESRRLTIHRQGQLQKILSKYDRVSLPISHFTKQHLRDPKLRNEDAYPAVKALLCDVLERTPDRLRLRQGIILGERDLP
jgi:hypothetical protein